MQGKGLQNVLARPGQPLLDHLRGVGQLAAQFAVAAAPHRADFHTAAALAGLLHDLGKLRPEFQQMLAGVRSKGVDTRHSFPGAIAASRQYKQNGAAFCIAGHHIGIPSQGELKQLLTDSEKVSLTNNLLAQLLATGVLPAATTPIASGPTNPLLFEMQTRLLFSCLVDADWRNSASVAGGMHEIAPLLDPQSRLRAVLDFIDGKSATCRSELLRDTRKEVLCESLVAAEKPQGVFSMAVPTGGGKTLAGLAFALAHAAKHNLRRIIYVAPYLSIIEQNARVWREALGLADDPADPTLLEHHSLTRDDEPESETNGSPPIDRRMAENWESPIIVTTSVQFLESLFTNRPGRSRKLHNVARSVVVLDECQTLPFPLIAPTVRMLGQLTEPWGISLLLSTATQPAWQQSDALPHGLEVTEIVPNASDLHRRLARVRASWPAPAAAPTEPQQLAAQLCTQSTALCIVNTRAKAREIFGLCQPNHPLVLHLSTSMCPDHRIRVLDTVRQRLRNNAPTLLISTQLIEAGVDVDFPAVFRELAPLDAIIQAAGRCNREGLLNTTPGAPGGIINIFSLTDGTLPLDNYHKNATAQLRASVEAGTPPDLTDPDAVAKCQSELLIAHAAAANDVITDLRIRRDFPQVCEKYRLVEDNSVSLSIENYPFCADEVRDLTTRLPQVAARRRLSRFSVNVFKYEADVLAKQGMTHLHPADPTVTLFTGPYHPDLGIVPSITRGDLII